MTLKESLGLKPEGAAFHEIKMASSVAPIPPADDAIVVKEVPAEVVEETEILAPKAVGPVLEERVRTFVALTDAGLSKAEAAKMIGTSVGEMNRDPKILEKVNEVLKYTMTPDERRALLRASVNKIMVESGDERAVLAAAKLAGMDPEVGLEKGIVGLGTGNTVFSDNTLVVLNSAPKVWKDETKE